MSIEEVRYKEWVPSQDQTKPGSSMHERAFKALEELGQTRLKGKPTNYELLLHSLIEAEEVLSSTLAAHFPDYPYAPDMVATTIHELRKKLKSKRLGIVHKSSYMLVELDDNGNPIVE